MHLAGTAWLEIWTKLTAKQREKLKEDVRTTLVAASNSLETRVDPHTLTWVSNPVDFGPSFFSEMSLAISAAALLHDLGHTPFSHALEGFYERNLEQLVGHGDGLEEESNIGTLLESLAAGVAGSEPKFAFHELVGLQLLSYIEEDATADFARYVVGLILRGGELNTWQEALHELISAEIDVDRVDYLMRDANRAGTEFGAIDHHRLFQSIEMHPADIPTHAGKSKLGWAIGYGYRARTAIESFLTNRIRYYQLVLFHHRVVAMNKVLEESVEQLLMLESATAETPRDRAILAQFRRLRPNLNYISKDLFLETSLETANTQLMTLVDRDAVRLISEVDDTTVHEWLRNAASLARAVRAETRAGSFATQLVRLDALVQALQFRVQNWLPLWKAEDHYVEFAEEIAPELIRTITAIRDNRREFLELAKLEDASARDIGRLSRQVVTLTALLSDLNEAPAVGLNTIARWLFDRRDATARRREEMRLREYLRQNTKLSGALTKGIWLVSFQRTSAVRTGTSGVHIYRFGKKFGISEISSLVAHLPAIAETYPQLFVFFMLPDQDDFANSKKTVPLLEQFKVAFPKYVAAYLPDVVESIVLTH